MPESSDTANLLGMEAFHENLSYVEGLLDLDRPLTDAEKRSAIKSLAVATLYAQSLQTQSGPGRYDRALRLLNAAPLIERILERLWEAYSTHIAP